MREVLLPGQHGEIGIRTEAKEETVTDRYGRPVVRTRLVWIAYAGRRSMSTGRYEQRSARASTEEGARKLLEERLKHDAKKLPPRTDRSGVDKSTVRDFAAAWLEEKRFEAKLETTSLATYVSVISVHIVPSLGDFRIEQLTLARVKGFLKDLHTGTDGRPGSRANAKKAKGILMGILDLAAEEKAVESNVLLGTRFTLPKNPRTDATILPADRVAEVFARADQHTYNAGRLGQYIRVQLGTGARIGEVLALRRRDYSPRTETSSARVRIEGTIIDPSAGSVYRKDAPKTSKSRRDIAITSYAEEAIEARLAILDGKGLAGSDELIFQTEKGTPVSPANLRRTWRQVRADVPGLETLKPHALRAAMASMLTYSVGAEKAARQLGHDGTATLYAHYLARRQKVDDVDLSSMELDDPS
jgi:integrase